MTSYVSMTLKVHHAAGTTDEIVSKVSAAVMAALEKEPDYPLSMTVETSVDEHTGECSAAYCGHEAEPAEGFK